MVAAVSFCCAVHFAVPRKGKGSSYFLACKMQFIAKLNLFSNMRTQKVFIKVNDEIQVNTNDSSF